MSASEIDYGTPRGHVLLARLFQVIAYPGPGRIGAAEANPITREVNEEIRAIEAAMRAASFGGRL